LSVIVLLHGVCAANIEAYESDDVIDQLLSEREVELQSDDMIDQLLSEYEAEAGQLYEEEGKEYQLPFESDVKLGQNQFEGDDVAYPDPYDDVDVKRNQNNGDSVEDSEYYEGSDVAAEPEKYQSDQVAAELDSYQEDKMAEEPDLYQSDQVAAELDQYQGDNTEIVESSDENGKAHQSVDLDDDEPYEVDYSEAEDGNVEFDERGLGTCDFTCKNGRAFPNPNYIATPNGCGSYGLTVEISLCPYLTNCCNKHDFCYGRCGEARSVCDDAFKECNNMPPSTMNWFTQGICKAAGKTMYFAVRVGGCPAFKKGQEKACICK